MKSKNSKKTMSSMKIKSIHCSSSMKGSWPSSKPNSTSITPKNLTAAFPYSPSPKSLKGTPILPKLSIPSKPLSWNPEWTKTTKIKETNNERIWCWEATNSSSIQLRRVLQITIVITREGVIKWRKSLFWFHSTGRNTVTPLKSTKTCAKKWKTI